VTTVLLVADLEGIAGVDDVRDLVAGSPGFHRARELMTAEVRAAALGLLAGGAGRVVVLDTHRSGAPGPTVIPEAMPDRVVVEVGEAWDAGRFDGIDALAFVGMHAAAGAPGFAAHTVSVGCRWRAAGRELSETDLVVALAAEAGVPGVSLRLPPVLEIDFKSRWMAEAAATHGQRRGVHTVRVSGETLREACARGAEAVAASDPVLARVRGDVGQMLARRFPQGRPVSRRDEARRALTWFLAAEGGLSQRRALRAPWRSAQGGARSAPRFTHLADRALVLTMLAGHAPGFFAAEGLGGALAAAIDGLGDVPASFPVGLAPAEAMARLDALYLAPRAFDVDEVARYVVWLAGAAPPVWAWLMAELLAQMGHARPVRLPARQPARDADLYALTHLPLLSTDYLRRPLAPGLEAEIEELTLAVPEVLAEERIDLAAEIALALQAAGEVEIAEHHDLLARLAARQHPDGSVADPSTVGVSVSEAARLRVHTTGVALVALAYMAT